MLFVGAAGTASPADGSIGNGFFATISVEGKLAGIVDVRFGVDVCDVLRCVSGLVDGSVMFVVLFLLVRSHSEASLTPTMPTKLSRDELLDTIVACPLSSPIAIVLIRLISWD